MHIDNLILEITRRCNMKCGHCLRGPSQRLDMSVETITALFNQVDSIFSLTLTGGEPSLKPEIISRIASEIRCRGIDMNYFYIVTNAHSTYKRIEFLDALRELQWQADEPESCSLEVSQDQYHKYEHQPNLKYYNDMRFDEFYMEYVEPPEYIHLQARKYPIQELIDDGFAKNVSSKKRPEKNPRKWIVSYDEDGMNVSSERYCYISANGNVTSAANMSYKRFDELCLGNIHETPLQYIIESNCISEEEYYKELRRAA